MKQSDNKITLFGSILKTGFTKPLSKTGQTIDSLINNQIEKAPILLTPSLGVPLNPTIAKIEPILKKLEDIEYRPPKKSLFKFSLKALLNPKRAITRVLPRTGMIETKRILAKGHHKYDQLK